MKLKPNSADVLAYLQANDKGEGVSIAEIASALGKEEKQIRPTITLSLGRAAKDGSRGVLATYTKKPVGTEGKEVGYATLTDEGKAFDNDAQTEK